MRLDAETVWLSQAQIVEFFQSSKANISEHINKIILEGEVDPAATVRDFRTDRMEGARKVSRELEPPVQVGARDANRVLNRVHVFSLQSGTALVVRAQNTLGERTDKKR